MHTWTVVLLILTVAFFVAAAVMGTTPDRLRSWHFWAALGFAAFFAVDLVHAIG